MDFDLRTLGLLLLEPTSPDFSAEELDRLQDAHLAHLADLYERGDVLAAGPLPGPDDRERRGLIVYGCDPDRAAVIGRSDPMVVARRFRHEVLSWLVPAGVMLFTPGRLPRSTAEAEA
jgi:uncharacterized protein